jgi:hypothetical protein
MSPPDASTPPWNALLSTYGCTLPLARCMAFSSCDHWPPYCSFRSEQWPGLTKQSFYTTQSRVFLIKHNCKLSPQALLNFKSSRQLS